MAYLVLESFPMKEFAEIETIMLSAVSGGIAPPGPSPYAMGPRPVSSYAVAPLTVPFNGSRSARNERIKARTRSTVWIRPDARPG